MMRSKWMSSVLLLGLLLAAITGVSAQSPEVEWDSWNAQITAYSDSNQVDVAETQVINVLDGQLQAGQRDYSQPVDIQSVYLAMNGDQPMELSSGDGAGEFQVFEDNGGVVLEYQLPEPAQAGDSFVVQINYAAEVATAGLVDWYVVPGDHGAPVNSSTVTINFPDGEAPDPSFVRLIESTGTVSVAGSSIVIQSDGVIPANQAFGIQVPFGSGVGAPANNPGNSNPAQQPSQPVPTGGTSNDSGGLGSILPILCILGVVLLFGGGNLLRGLLGGLGGGGNPLGGGTTGRGNPFGGIGRGSSGTSGGTSSGGRGFRPSSNQNRSVPTVKSDKNRGGGASFK
jgi:hypothetical protein